MSTFLNSEQNNRKFVNQMKNEGAIKFGVNLNLANSIVAEMIAYYGYDFIMVDTQHSAYNREKLAGMFQAIKLGGSKSFVRVEGPDDRYGIQQAFDLGCDGILVPFINTADDVKKAIASAKYPGREGKEGTRSLYLNLRKTLAHGGGAGGMMSSYLDANPNTIVAIQIETAEALRNLDEIMAVPELDIAFVGPGDLCSSMGLLTEKQFEGFADPAFTSAVSQVAETAKKYGVIPGMWGSMDIEGTIANGFQWVIVNSDAEFLRQAIETQRNELIAKIPNWKPRNAPADPSDV